MKKIILLCSLLFLVSCTPIEEHSSLESAIIEGYTESTTAETVELEIVQQVTTVTEIEKKIPARFETYTTTKGAEPPYIEYKEENTEPTEIEITTTVRELEEVSVVTANSSSIKLSDGEDDLIIQYIDEEDTEKDIAYVDMTGISYEDGSVSLFE